MLAKENQGIFGVVRYLTGEVGASMRKLRIHCPGCGPIHQRLVRGDIFPLVLIACHPEILRKRKLDDYEQSQIEEFHLLLATAPDLVLEIMRMAREEFLDYKARVEKDQKWRLIDYLLRHNAVAQKGNQLIMLEEVFKDSTWEAGYSFVLPPRMKLVPHSKLTAKDLAQLLSTPELEINESSVKKARQWLAKIQDRWDAAEYYKKKI